MIIVISPAKKLDMDCRLSFAKATQPEFLPQAEILVNILRQKDSFQLAELMHLSMKLADLNQQRFHHWQPPFDLNNATYALAAFQGDVYQTLAAKELNEQQLAFASQHLRILSGLYGLLRPDDLIQAYRLEMGTRMRNPAGDDLYAYWRERVSAALSQLMVEQDDKVLLNLASQEYFKAVDVKTMPGRVVTPIFKEFHKGSYKVIGIYAKRARGIMTRYIINHAINEVDELKDFEELGYRYCESESDAQRWVFSRKNVSVHPSPDFPACSVESAHLPKRKLRDFTLQGGKIKGG